MNENSEVSAVPTEAPEVDVNKLASAEGAATIPTLKTKEDGSKTQPTEQDSSAAAEGQEGKVSTEIPESEDITKQIAAQQQAASQERGAPGHGGTEAEKSQHVEKDTTVSTEAAPGELNPDYDKMFGMLEQKLGKENVSRPEQLTDENYLDELAKVFYENADWSQSFDPKVLAIQDRIDNGTSFEEAVSPFAEKSDWEKMEPESKVRQWMEHGLKMTSEEIDAEIKNTNVNLKARELDVQYDQLKAYHDQQAFHQHNAMMEQIKNDRKEAYDSSLAQFNKIDEIWGIPVTAKQRQDFPNELKEMITPTEQGAAPIAEMLRNNEFLMKLAFFAKYGETGIKDLLSSTKSTVKQNMKEKLDPEPRFVKTQTLTDPQKVDLNALAAPARN